jgi:hypothetical protein
MRRSKFGVFVVAAAALLPHLGQAEAADCQVISATHGGHWQGEALSMSQALATRSANDLKAQKKWRSMTMKAYQVKPEPFFKTVRPEVPTGVISGTFVTARAYTTCWTGITVPYVCTSGAKVCGN